MKLINLKNYLIKYFKLFNILLIILLAPNLANAKNNFETYLKKEIYSNKLSQLEIDSFINLFHKLDKNSDNKLTFEEINEIDFLYQEQLIKYKKFIEDKNFYGSNYIYKKDLLANFFKKNIKFFILSDKDMDNKLDKKEFLDALIANKQLINFLYNFKMILDNNFSYHEYNFYNEKINYFFLNNFLSLKYDYTFEDTDVLQSAQDKDYFSYYTFLDLYEIAIQK